VICVSCEVVEHLPAVLALVDLLSSVGLNVGSEVVAASVALPANMTAEGLLSGVDPHVPAKVSGSNEFAAAHFARVRSLLF